MTFKTEQDAQTSKSTLSNRHNRPNPPQTLAPTVRIRITPTPKTIPRPEVVVNNPRVNMIDIMKNLGRDRGHINSIPMVILHHEGGIRVRETQSNNIIIKSIIVRVVGVIQIQIIIRIRGSILSKTKIIMMIKNLKNKLKKMKK